jgi:excisionase family DNA binding protein
MQPKYLTTAEVARRLGVSRGRVWQFVSEGRIKAVRFGHGFLFDPADIPAMSIDFPPRKKRGPAPRKKTSKKIGKST